MKDFAPVANARRGKGPRTKRAARRRRLALLLPVRRSGPDTRQIEDVVIDPKGDWFKC